MVIFLNKNLKDKTRLDASKETSVNEVVVPDTSIIVHGTISREVEAGSLIFKKILIHEAVIAELESQANKGRESGFLGLDEIKKIRELSSSFSFDVEFLGSRPGDFEIKFAKAGEIDSLIRDLAIKNNATLLTADLVQGKVSLAKGLSVKIFEVLLEKVGFLGVEKFFIKGAMSVHLREGCRPKAKVGRPGSWEYVDVGDEVLSLELLESFNREIIDFVKSNEDSFIESEKKFSVVVQIKDMRVVIVRSPFSDAFEITCVRPISNLSFEDYKLSESLQDRLLKNAEGLLIAGPPGHGKSTFVQALANSYSSLNKSVKTLESPRDLVVDKSITRYGSSHAHNSDIRDVLLLSRPDFVLFDEVRNVEDFRLFSDLRLSGIGMLGVLHASEPIDAVQRFIGRVDLGVIPHVLDTVVFILDGVIKKVFSLSLSVKVPSGMVEADLARPVIMVNDFFTGELEFEVYSYGEEAIVVPINSFSMKKPAYTLAEKLILSEVKNLGFDDVSVEFLSDNKCAIYVPKDFVSSLIGPKGSNISALEKKFNLKIDVLEKKASKKSKVSTMVNFDMRVTSKHVIFDLDNCASDSLVSLFVDDAFLMSVKASKKSQLKINIDSPNGKLLSDAKNLGKKISIFLN